MTTTWTIPRESKEWVGPLEVTINNTPTTAFQVAVLPRGTRPLVWQAPDPLDGGLGVLVGPGSSRPLGAGAYALWVRVADDPEDVVLDDAGTIRVT